MAMVGSLTVGLASRSREVKPHTSKLEAFTRDLADCRWCHKHHQVTIWEVWVHGLGLRVPCGAPVNHHNTGPADSGDPKLGNVSSDDLVFRV